MSDPKTPTAPFPYTMHTTGIMEHRNGVAWTADLRRDGVHVGVIEQDGRGGCDMVSILNPAARKEWNQAVLAAFNDDEEAATYWLLVQEESGSMFGDDTT